MLPVYAIIGMASAFTFSVGFTYPALALLLEARGYSASTIGLLGAMAGSGVLVGSLIVTRLAQAIGPWPLGFAALLIGTLSIVSFGIGESLVAIFIARGVLGLSMSMLFVLSETWVNQLAPPALRGRAIGLYTSAVAGAFALGPALIPLVGYQGITPYAVAAAAFLAMGLPMITVRRLIGPLHGSPGNLFSIFPVVPVLLLAVAAFAYMDGSTMGLWVIYALDHGIGEDRASLTLTALIIGNVVLQIPIGWLADRLSRKFALIVCAAAGCLGALWLPYIDLSGLFIWPFLFIWGALMFGVYTIALTIVGDHLEGADLMRANAAFGIMWGVGALAGASLTGWMMDLFGLFMLPLGIALIYAALFAAILLIAPVRQRKTV